MVTIINTMYWIKISSGHHCRIQRKFLFLRQNYIVIESHSFASIANLGPNASNCSFIEDLISYFFRNINISHVYRPTIIVSIS